ncbi:hypothetical protein K1T71_007062 [Dendrolimus kikuchii]|uniref:Uncharacterized protein n=1 Tax=Dendrolimus kikuchii TaxID=765133 RepID=A0ACC1CZE9_9NEOP|nr:hypothetical protein K1T71_007062 [Dendrolimus kikuchii]
MATSSQCPCTEESSTAESLLSPHCECPRGEHEIVIHQETCLLYKNEQIIYPHRRSGATSASSAAAGGGDAGPSGSNSRRCWRCGKAHTADRCKFKNYNCDECGQRGHLKVKWRRKRDGGAMPAVLEASHPLMQKFQETLTKFLEKENAIAEEEILNLRDELRLKKLAYDRDLEAIYRSDHDTNAQRALIEEYENTLTQKAAEREAEEKRARESNEKYKKAKAQLEQDVMTEREATEELEALTALCKQLEAWREETESDLTVSQRMSDKMRAEKRALADEKRQLDMIIFGLSQEVWKLESKLETFQKQMEIKNSEMEKVNDKVTAYAAELEDLELDKRRLVSLWNSVLVNIQQRDKVYDSVRDDYKNLQENYRTLINNLEITKKVVMEEMNKGKELTMNKDKLTFDIEHVTKLFENEDMKRIKLESHVAELSEAIEMTERDQNMTKMENQTMRNILKSTEKEYDRKQELKLKLENEILKNLQECLLNDKAVESMANGIKKMREMSRKQEISLMTMENQHAKIMLDIEVHRNKQARNNQILEENLAKVREKEKEIDQLQEKYDHKVLLITRKQRELDIILKKYTALKEIFDLKSPQERRIEELEQQIKSLRERTEGMQHEWLRLQGHVVKLTEQHHKMLADINLISKQIQICEQKIMRIQVECENVSLERAHVDRNLRELRGRLEVLQRTRKDSMEKNDSAQRCNLAITHEYAANLKAAESDIIQLEEEIEEMDKDKMNLTQDLDRVQREALIWQRKGILAVELKKNISNAKSAAGEIGQMKTEIHRMEVRREQLRRTGEKLAEDLALYVTRRDTAMEKTRAAAAVEKAHGHGAHTSQSTYHHKLRLAKADLARVNKDLAEAKTRMAEVQKEQERLDNEMKTTSSLNSQLEERVATLLRESRETERQKQWLLERVVRSQRLEFPHLNDKFEVVSNTLKIFSPSGSPRLTDEGGECSVIEEEDLNNVAEKPLCP